MPHARKITYRFLVTWLMIAGLLAACERREPTTSVPPLVASQTPFLASTDTMPVTITALASPTTVATPSPAPILTATELPTPTTAPTTVSSATPVGQCAPADMNWKRLNPLKYGYDLYDGYLMPNTCNIWLVGAGPNDGVILRSTDGGLNFQTSPVPAHGSQLKHIVFANTQRAWIAGNQDTTGILLRSADGGESWAQQALPPGKLAVSALAYSGNQLYVAVYASAGDQAFLFASDNDGESWRKVYGLSGSSLTLITAIAVANKAIILMASDGGRVIGAVTTDGGLDFHPMSGLDEITRAWDLAMVDDKTVYLAGDYSQTGRPEQGHAVLLRSLDGGLNWKATHIPENPYPFMSVLFFSPELGLVLAGDGTVYSIRISGEGEPQLEAKSLDPRAKATLHKFFRGNAGTAYAVGTSGLYNGSP